MTGFNTILNKTFDLFLAQLENNTGNFKMLNALESAARKTNRQAKLMETYFELGKIHKNLLGRGRRLKKVMERE